MLSLDFDWQTNEFMLYCRTTQLREKSMMAYEQSLKLFGRWCMDEMDVFTLSKIPGHSSVEVTEKAYLDLNGDDISKQYQRSSPLASHQIV